MILALLLVVALLVEKFLPRSRHPKGEIAGALFAIVLFTYIITVSMRKLPTRCPRTSLRLFQPAAAYSCRHLFGRVDLVSPAPPFDASAFDRSVYAATWLNFAAQLAASQSARLMDSPFVFSQALSVIGYAVALGGALLDNAASSNKSAISPSAIRSPASPTIAVSRRPRKRNRAHQSQRPSLRPSASRSRRPQKG